LSLILTMLIFKKHEFWHKITIFFANIGIV
jgi:hypothetical protein